jgi:transposase-like protein
MCSSQNNTGVSVARGNFTPVFKRLSDQLVADQNYTVSYAANDMGVGLSTMTKWVKRLR